MNLADVTLQSAGLNDLARLMTPRLSGAQGLSHELAQWWNQELLQSWRSFEQTGWPTLKSENWRYTPVADIVQQPLRLASSQPAQISSALAEKLKSALTSGTWNMVFVNGKFSAELSTPLSQMNAQVNVTSFSSLLAAKSMDGNSKQWLETLRRFSGLGDEVSGMNQMLLQDANLIDVQGGGKHPPIRLIQVFEAGLDQSERSWYTSRVVLRVGSQASASVLSSAVYNDDSDFFSNELVDIVAEEGSKLEYVEIKEPLALAFRFSTVRILQEPLSEVSAFCLSLGGKVNRHNLILRLLGEGAKAHAYGLTVAEKVQHVDHWTQIEHLVPNCSSRQVYKAILSEQAQGVFSGKIHIHPGAQKTDTAQFCRSLLMSPQAQMNARPQLQIEADDVKASHGATVGQLDEEQVFYLGTRGITRSQALSMLATGFASEIALKIESPYLQQQSFGAVLNRVAELTQGMGG